MELSLTTAQWIAIGGYATSLLGSLLAAVWYMSRLVERVTSLITRFDKAVEAQADLERRFVAFEEWRKWVTEWIAKRS